MIGRTAIRIRTKLVPLIPQSARGGGSSSRQWRPPRPAAAVPRRRVFSTAPPPRPGIGPWSSLPESCRAAWEALGWDSDSWEGRMPPPPSSSTTWAELSPDQKAAALHGLGYTGESWDADGPGRGGWLGGGPRQREPEGSERRSPALTDDGGPAKPKTVPAGRLFRGGEDGAAATSVAGPAWDLAKVVAKAAAEVLAPTLVDRFSQPVVVDDVETTLYLDDSPSMTESMGGGGRFGSTTRLEEGKRVVRWLGPLLDPLPCRVLKFGARPSVLALRDEDGDASSTSLALSGWNGSSIGTYLWHMIEQDILKRYRPGGGKLRLVVVTDGEDNMSPPRYRGMRGMDPMMRTLQSAGYDIEWHIVVIGGDGGLRRYEALAGATGGSFLAVREPFDETSRDSSRFFGAVESSGEVDGESRRERQRQYELDTKRGKVERVDWYKALPPGDKN